MNSTNNVQQKSSGPWTAFCGNHPSKVGSITHITGRFGLDKRRVSTSQRAVDSIDTNSQSNAKTSAKKVQDVVLPTQQKTDTVPKTVDEKSVARAEQMPKPITISREERIYYAGARRQRLASFNIKLKGWTTTETPTPLSPTQFTFVEYIIKQNKEHLAKYPFLANTRGHPSSYLSHSSSYEELLTDLEKKFAGFVEANSQSGANSISQQVRELMITSALQETNTTPKTVDEQSVTPADQMPKPIDVSPEEIGILKGDAALKRSELRITHLRLLQLRLRKTLTPQDFQTAKSLIVQNKEHLAKYPFLADTQTIYRGYTNAVLTYRQLLTDLEDTVTYFESKIRSTDSVSICGGKAKKPPGHL